MNTKIPLPKLGKHKLHPVFKDLPEALKDTACFADIEKRLANAMHSDHKHATLKGFMRCKRCIAKMGKRQAIMNEVGFKSIEQYLEWKRVMSLLIGRQQIQLS